MIQEVFRARTHEVVVSFTSIYAPFFLSFFRRRQIDKFEEEIAIFQTLPQSRREQMLGQLLGRNEDARKIFEDNHDIFPELGFHVNSKNVIFIAKRVQKRKQSHQNYSK